MRTALLITLLGGNPFAQARAAALGAGAKLWYAEAAVNLTGFAFQDSPGTTAAVATNALGLWISKEQPVLLGANILTNGDFSSGTTGWTLGGTGAAFSVTDGVASITAGTTTTFINRTITTVAGKTYEFAITRVGGDAADVRARVDGTTVTSPQAAAGVTTRRYFVAAGASSQIGISLANSLSTQVATIDDIAVCELLAAPATQATAANRPTLTAQANAIVAPVYDATNDALTFALASAGTPDVVTFTDTGEVTGYDSATTTAFVLGQTKLAGKKVFLVVAHASAIPAAALAKARKLAGVLRGSAY